MRIAPRAASASRIADLSSSGTSSRVVDSTSDTCTRPSRAVTAFTSPSDTMSRSRPGYRTPFSASRAAATEMGSTLILILLAPISRRAGRGAVI